MTLLLAVGVAGFLWASVHVFSRGLWLGITSSGSSNQLPDNIGTAVSKRLDSAASTTYDLVFTQWIGVIVIAPFLAAFLASSALELFLRSALGSTSALLRVISIIIPFGALITVLFLVFFQRLPAKGVRRSAVEFLTVVYKRWLFSFASIVVFWIAVTEACFTAHLHVYPTVASRSQQRYIQVSVSLGGAASDPSRVSVALVSGDGANVQELELHPLVEGKQIALIPTGQLSDRVYNVVLRYPRFFIDLNYPFWHSEVRQVEAFAVRP